jgi:hypothetical protein
VAVFGLWNPGPADVTMEVGFPIFAEAELNDFAAWVDGVPQKVERKVVPGEKDAAGPAFGAPTGSAPGAPSAPREHTVAKRAKAPAAPPNPFAAWQCWTLAFPARREVQVKVSYWVKPSVRPALHGRSPEDLKAKLAHCLTGYVLRTGAAWAGGINKATVRIHYSDALPRGNVEYLYPPWPKTKAAGAWQYDEKTAVGTLVLDDFEPSAQSDVQLVFKAHSAGEELGVLMGALRAGVLDIYGRRYLDELLGKGAAALGLAEADWQARRIEFFEHCVPPLGPAIDDETVKTGVIVFQEQGLERRAFATLFAHYRAAGADAKARSLAPHYRDFLTRAIAWSRQRAAAFQAMKAQMAGRRIEVNFGGADKDETPALEAELRQVESFLAGRPTG